MFIPVYIKKTCILEIIKATLLNEIQEKKYKTQRSKEDIASSVNIK